MYNKDGDIMLVATRKQMQRIDEIYLKTYSIEELVDKASDCLLDEVVQYSSICIVCGSGNNGADGYSLALKLNNLNKKVVVIASNTIKMSQACRYYYEKCKDLIVDVNTINILDYDVVVDGLFGFGCHSNPQGFYEKLIKWINTSNNIISIDVPSGLDCDSGEVYSNCVYANKTITFFAYKIGFYHPSALKVIGEVIIKQLDVSDISNEISLPESVETITFKKRSYDGHKGKYGKSFLICGSDSYQGAALLSTKACVNSGCGITCLYSNDNVLNSASIYVPEAIHAKNLENIHHYSSILIGCGCENNEELLEKILKETTQPLVIDATSLTDLSKNLHLLENQHRPIILTPHLGEFRRLCPDFEDPIISAIEFANKYHVILMLKGPHTLITNGTISYRNTTGNGAMAIGGCGDVLAGMIVSYLAQGYEPMQAVVNAVYLHGLIGDEIAKEEYSVLPSKIIEYIPKMMKKKVDEHPQK